MLKLFCLLGELKVSESIFLNTHQGKKYTTPKTMFFVMPKRSVNAIEKSILRWQERNIVLVGKTKVVEINKIASFKVHFKNLGI